MTIAEAGERYKIPPGILTEYMSWEPSGAGEKETEGRQCDDSDLERLSLMTTLYDAGFCMEEIGTYMRLLQEENTDGARLKMLECRREKTLEEIHFREKQLERLDYLRYEIRSRRAAAGKNKEEK